MSGPSAALAFVVPGASDSHGCSCSTVPDESAPRLPIGSLLVAAAALAAARRSHASRRRRGELPRA